LGDAPEALDSPEQNPMRNIPTGNNKVIIDIVGGVEGLDDDANNPLSRALKVTLNDGKPDVSRSLCFCSPPIQRDQGTSLLRWIGAFVVSSDRRVIFSPGFIPR
jgi:hypothetical protein